MKIRFSILLLSILAPVFWPLGPAPVAIADQPISQVPPISRSDRQAFVPGRVLVGLTSRTPTDPPIFRTANPSLVGTASLSTLSSGIVTVAEGSEALAIETMKADPSVKYAELDYTVSMLSEPVTSAFLSRSWNLSLIRVGPAWDIVSESDGPLVAILDTGVDASHPNLAGRVLPGYDFINRTGDTSDDNGHGTHIAGIVAAAVDGSAPVAGVAPRSRILPAKVLDSEGNGSVSLLASAIVWATDQGSRIINLSLGTANASATLQDAISYAHSKGAVIVAAAGNNYLGNNLPVYPAAYPEVIAVAATTDTDGHASYSSSGVYVDLAAPGGDPSGHNDGQPGHWIMSTYSSGGDATYARLAGTSQASAHVAGVAALLLSVNPGLRNLEVRSLLERTATDLGTPGRDELYGYGRVDAGTSVEAARAEVKPSPPPVQQSPLRSGPAYRIFLPLLASNGTGTW